MQTHIDCFFGISYDVKIMVLYLAYVRNKFYKSDMIQYMTFAVHK